MALLLGHWICNPEVLGSKSSSLPLDGCVLVSSASAPPCFVNSIYSICLLISLLTISYN